jgi:hypothetical protein
MAMRRSLWGREEGGAARAWRRKGSLGMREGGREGEVLVEEGGGGWR